MSSDLEAGRADFAVGFPTTKSMKLVIQIPCWNEQASISDVVRSLPSHIPGINSIEVVVIDDGSIDATATVASQAGVDEVVKLPRHLGLADAFSAGIQTALRRNADILVNTDADLQYPPQYIPALIEPILNGHADIVIGDRLSGKPAPFPPLKMFLERLGTFFVRVFSRVPVKDAASGFRAFDREALLAMFIHGRFSYTMESLMLAGHNRLRVANIPITVNSPRRKSRLVKNIPGYMVRSVSTVVRAFLMYYPLRFFVGLGMALLAVAFVLGARYLVYLGVGRGEGHVQSLILLLIFALMGFQSIALGLIGDVVAGNRRLLEELRLNQYRRDPLS
jgi:glycosyltransferase involved in cell wall biosynthesis